jgi:hypothetical protein
LSEHIDTLGARITSLAVQDARTILGQPTATWGTARTQLNEISNTLKRELSLQTLLVLEAKEQSYFTPKEPHFGMEVASKFQAAAFEVDEAAKCLALGRSTASTFHLMRVLEIGIRAVARSLQIPNPTKPAEKNWAIILKAVWVGIEAKWPTAAHRMTGDGQIFEALYASLDAVKNPWRNATMHVENKYTNGEAEHVFMAVRGFMKKLASRMDENGLPLA